MNSQPSHDKFDYVQRWMELIRQNRNKFYYETDLRGALKFVSPEVEAVLAIRPEELIAGEPGWDKFEDHSTISRREVLAERGGHLHFASIRDPKNQDHWLELVEYPLLDKTGQRIGWRGLANDVTDIRLQEIQSREKENRFRQIIEFSPVGIFQSDAEDKFIYVNTRWQTITRRSLKDILGEPWWKPIFPEDREEVFLKWTQGEKNQQGCFCQCRILRPGGEIRWVELRSRFLFHDGGKSIFGTVEDITERIILQSQLESFSRELQRSNRDLQDFATIASHDLQEPLRKILTFGDRLVTALEARDLSRAEEYLDRIRNAGDRMETFIKDLLDFSRVTTKAKPFVEIPLNDLVQEVLSDLEVGIAKNGARVTLEALPVIMGDPFQMRQLFQNLIGNALKFHREGVSPEIRISASGMVPGQWEIKVEDNGIGFDELYLDRIFKPFERLNGRSQFEGSGMGLAICKKIVERHEGSLTAKGVSGSGACFLITLPGENNSGVSS